MTALENLLQDLRYSVRQFRERPGFAAVAVLVLGLGLGANAAIFSVVNTILLHAPPYTDPARLVVIHERDIEPGSGPAQISYLDFRDWSAQTHTLENLAIARETQFNLAGGRSAVPERVGGVICSWTLLPALGSRPLMGRVLLPGDDEPGARRVTVIGYSLWQDRFAGAADVLGRQVRLDAEDYTIVGVMPETFAYPAPRAQLWVPVVNAIGADARSRRGWRQFHGLAHLRPGYGIDQARIELDSLALRIRAENPGIPLAAGVSMVPLVEFMTRNIRTALLVLFGGVACVLLIACMNVSNLLLARASQRQKEMAIRAALGSSRRRLIRQLLTESLLLALTGAGFGLVLATFMIEALAAAVPALVSRGEIQPIGEVHLDAWVFVFITAVAALVGVAAGLLPALQISGSDLMSMIREQNRSITPSRARAAFRNTLIAAEVALSLVLLVAAGLLLRSFLEIRSVHSGVSTDNLLTAGISLPSGQYRTAQSVTAFEDELRRKLTALPGVRGADLSSCLPIDGFCGDQFFAIDGHTLAPGHMLDAFNWAVTPGFFQTMGIPILRGRPLTAQDEQRSRSKSNRYSAVISEAMAKRFWPGEDPVGQTIHFGDAADDPRWEVVGVCGDVVSSLDEKPEPAYFVPLGEWRTFYAVIATGGSPELLSTAVRQAISSLDPDVPAFKVRTMQQVTESSRSSHRLSAVLIGLFAAIAVILAATGLYGVLSYLVSQRTGEIGIRVMLGATRMEIQRLVLTQGMRPVLTGIAVGLAAAMAATRLLRSLLFGVSSNDPATFLIAALVLTIVALLACCIPAWKAGRVDPAAAVRND
jgi:putative ABC transport system permease protein